MSSTAQRSRMLHEYRTTPCVVAEWQEEADACHGGSLFKLWQFLEAQSECHFLGALGQHLRVCVRALADHLASKTHGSV